MQNSFDRMLLRLNSIFSYQRTERDGLRIHAQAVFLCLKLFLRGCFLWSPGSRRQGHDWYYDADKVKSLTVYQAAMPCAVVRRPRQTAVADKDDFLTSAAAYFQVLARQLE